MTETYTEDKEKNMIYVFNKKINEIRTKLKQPLTSIHIIWTLMVKVIITKTSNDKYNN